MKKFDYSYAEWLNYWLLDQSYVTGWNNKAFDLFASIIDDCRMCGRCRKCSKDSKPYRSLFLSALEDADKVLATELSTDEWFSKIDSDFEDANCKCHTYHERCREEEVSYFEDEILQGEYDDLTDEEFDNILISEFVQESE